MNSPLAPICLRCIRLLDEDTCQAFPEGIPDEIWLSGHDHREPFKGDGGLQFEPRAGVDLTHTFKAFDE